MLVSEIILDIDYSKLKSFVETHIIKKLFEKPKTMSNQISLQCREGLEEDPLALTESCNSLMWNWDDYDPERQKSPAIKPIIFKQSEFNLTPTVFKSTIIEDTNLLLHRRYGATRGRVMSLPQKSCLTYHVDESKRLHIPIICSAHSFLLIEREIFTLKYGTSYILDTTKEHTAINSSLDYRVHLVYCLPKI